MIDGLAGLVASVGVERGPGSWHLVEQDDVDRFADLSGDHQWIHVDPVRAAAGPYGGTIAHGLLTLASLPKIVGPLREVSGLRVGVNYGYDRVRFPAPVRVGDRIRGRVTVLDVSTAGDGGQQVRTLATVEIDGGDKPALVAEMLARQYF